MTESNERVESPTEIRRNAVRVITWATGIGIWFMTMMLLLNYGPKVRSDTELLTMVAIALIPAIASAMIVLGILKYIEGPNSN